MKFRNGFDSRFKAGDRVQSFDVVCPVDLGRGFIIGIVLGVVHRAGSDWYEIQSEYHVSPQNTVAVDVEVYQVPVNGLENCFGVKYDGVHRVWRGENET